MNMKVLYFIKNYAHQYILIFLKLMILNIKISIQKCFLSVFSKESRVKTVNLHLI